MKNLVSVLTILLIISNSISRAQVIEKVVINKKMIERFNDLKVDEDFITFNELVRELSFDEMKCVFAAYYTDQISINSRSEVDKAIELRKIDSEESIRRFPETRRQDDNE